MILPGNLHNLRLDQQTNVIHSGNVPIFFRNLVKQQLKPKLCDSRDFVMKLWSCEWNGLFFFWMSTRWQRPGKTEFDVESYDWHILVWEKVMIWRWEWNFDIFLPSLKLGYSFEIAYGSSSLDHPWIILGFWWVLPHFADFSAPLSQAERPCPCPAQRGVYDPSEQLLAPPPHQRYNKSEGGVRKWL